MIEHHLQRQIIANLVESETARYADLKPKHIEGNVFTYHLQALIKQHFIEKTEDGKYRLTHKGKLYGVNISLKKQDLLQQAHSIILLSIRQDNKWLLRKRLVQPLYGKIGFIHGEPMAGETVNEAAARILEKRTTLTGDFTVKGSGYITMRDEDNIIAFTHFTLVEVNNVEGNLRENDSHGENVWLTNPDFTSTDMIPSMLDITANLHKPGLFFIDKEYRVAP